MKHPRCQLQPQRPGVIESFIQPTKLKHQVRSGAQRTPVRFSPAGKTLVGGTQWVAKVMRPGLAAPMIVAKASPPATKAEVKPEEAAADMAKAAGAANGAGNAAAAAAAAANAANAAGFGRYFYA